MTPRRPQQCVMPITRAGIEFERESDEERSQTHRFEYDQETTTASMAVVGALSEVIGSDPARLEPLHNAVDTDALDAITTHGGSKSRDLSVAVTVEGYSVLVYSYGVITVTPPGTERTTTRNKEATRS